MNDNVASLVRLGIIMVAMCVALWANATHFDATEVRSIVAVFLTAACGEGVLNKLRNAKGSHEDRSNADIV